MGKSYENKTTKNNANDIRQFNKESPETTFKKEMEGVSMKQKTHIVMISARTATSAANTVRRYGRVPVKIKLTGKHKLAYGLKLYKVWYHIKE